jgi:hypothetical protein
MRRPRFRRRLVAQVSIYRPCCKGVESLKFAPEGKRKLGRIRRSERAHSHRDRHVRFVNDPDFPLSTFEFYRWNFGGHVYQRAFCLEFAPDFSRPSILRIACSRLIVVPNGVLLSFVARIKYQKG